VNNQRAYLLHPLDVVERELPTLRPRIAALLQAIIE